ncbi:MAG: hypothetical protein N4R93_08905 [Lactobacillus crispatus]|nr:hypothetical protein [Lactobacillus crispatus]MCT7745643.1 hypothetical protein [Lactobacillus crispatus]
MAEAKSLAITSANLKRILYNQKLTQRDLAALTGRGAVDTSYFATEISNANRYISLAQTIFTNEGYEEWLI